MDKEDTLTDIMYKNEFVVVRNADDDNGFTAYKKLSGGAVATLFIPADAMVRLRSPRIGSYTPLPADYKCRASYAIVKAIEEVDGSYSEVGFSKYDGSHYVVGEEYVPSDFHEGYGAFESGVHFFLDRKRAENYI